MHYPWPLLGNPTHQSRQRFATGPNAHTSNVITSSEGKVRSSLKRVSWLMNISGGKTNEKRLFNVSRQHGALVHHNSSRGLLLQNDSTGDGLQWRFGVYLFTAIHRHRPPAEFRLCHCCEQSEQSRNHSARKAPGAPKDEQLNYSTEMAKLITKQKSECGSAKIPMD